MSAAGSAEVLDQVPGSYVTGKSSEALVHRGPLSPPDQDETPPPSDADDHEKSLDPSTGDVGEGVLGLSDDQVDVAGLSADDHEGASALSADDHEDVAGVSADDHEGAAGLSADDREGVAALSADDHKDVAGVSAEDHEDVAELSAGGGQASERGRAPGPGDDERPASSTGRWDHEADVDEDWFKSGRGSSASGRPGGVPVSVCRDSHASEPRSSWVRHRPGPEAPSGEGSVVEASREEPYGCVLPSAAHAASRLAEALSQSPTNSRVDCASHEASGRESLPDVALPGERSSRPPASKSVRVLMVRCGASASKGARVRAPASNGARTLASPSNRVRVRASGSKASRLCASAVGTARS